MPNSSDRDRDVYITLTAEQREAVLMWRELDFDKMADARLTEAGLQIEEFYAASADFLDGCVARDELERETADRVKALYSKGVDEAKRGLQERISEARATLHHYRNKLRGEE